MSFLEKLKGDGATRPPRPPARAIALAWLGAAIAIATIALLAETTGTALVLGCFGASCVLAFGFPEAPFSQPRHIVGGHVLASLVGLSCLAVTGPTWWGMAIAVATSLAAMMLTRTPHPPAGSNPVMVYLLEPGWDFLVFPTLAGALILLSVALVFNNLVRPARYPKYW